MGFPLESCFSARANVQTRSLPDGAVLVDLHSGEVFEVNRIGAEIWFLMSKGTSGRAVCDALVDRYAIDRATIEADVIALLELLSRAGLVEPCGTGS